MILTGVSVGAVHLWESGKFMPKEKEEEEKKGMMASPGKLGRRDVRKLLKEKAVGKTLLPKAKMG